MKSKRGAVAVLVVALWIGGMAMMMHRNANRSEAQQLAEVSLRVQPETFYYIVERDGERVGAASSSIDTTVTSLVAGEYFVGDYRDGTKGAERTSARLVTRLTRGLHLLDLNADVARPTKPLALTATVQEDTAILIGTKANGRKPARYTFVGPLFTPTIAPVVFMLGGPPKIGRSQRISIFDPTSRTVLRPTLRIRAESLFTVVDSASLDKGGEWTAAHRDTVRGWRIEGAPHGLDAWVDEAGRVVAARAGSYSAIRTAFEIAFRNSKTK
ncbi:MAG: hypothetical protein M3Z54_00015 [Gemmatimonadota bacterium]|nr:hypothetical protein [Gemmatimonadota bacterium]